ncbi:hypothetical protein IEO21_09012 [Rhodonia placenta]|uniref:C2H2-type domain-containing protein n=1 Tax=Rhodonia placenta TaxID=104341 RepID=A0A8H7TYM9_9APHY|nr:hypothetical protein IEO21_09012 [Postia placenta]
MAVFNGQICQLCNVWFVDANALERHTKASFVHRDFQCPNCYERFHGPQELVDHRVAAHHCCVNCNRLFKSHQSLQMHLKSSFHKERTVPCPGQGCTKLFLSGAGLVNHLESGACPSRTTRHHVNKLAVRYDETNIVTNASRLLTGPDGHMQPKLPVVSIATSLSFNGTQFECFLCHRAFKTLGRLNEHLASPAHDDEIYKCPALWDGCGAEFRTLSGLCQHVESETCGIRRFNRHMQNVISEVTTAVGKFIH